MPVYFEMKKQEFIFLMLFLGCVLCLDLLISRNVFMLTEGWWETYAWGRSTGVELYSEMGLKFPPLYIWLIEFLRSTFSDNYLVVRYFLAGIHVISVALLYFWLRHFGSVAAALSGAAVATGLVMANPVYLAKDYHTLVALLVNFTLLALTRRGKSIGLVQGSMWTAIVGFSCGLLLLTKQNIGLFFSGGVLFYFIARLMVGRSKNIAFLNVVVWLALFLTPAIILTILQPDWLSIFSGNDAKGSIFTVLFRFLLDREALIISFGAAVLMAFLYGANRVAIVKAFVNYANKQSLRSMAPILGIVVIISLGNFFRTPLLILALAWPLVRALGAIPGGRPLFPASDALLFFPLMALAYCGTLSAGYNAVSLEILIALMICEIYSLFAARLEESKSLRPELISLIIFIGLISPKLYAGFGYDWWGLKAGRVLPVELVELQEPKLKGIFTDTATAEMVREIEKARTTLGPSGSVFAFPSIPLVYDLLEKQPIGAPVLWFDVTTNAEVLRTLNKLESDPPNIIFWLRPPENVYVGHARLRRSDPALLAVDKWLVSKIETGEYKVKNSILSYDPNLQFEVPTAPFLRSIELSQKAISPARLAYYRDACGKYRGCGFEATGVGYIFRFKNPKSYREFSGSVKDLMESSDHVLYVLERSSN